MNTCEDPHTGELLLPSVIFLGDFNTGKSCIINALLRENVMFTSREESLVPPVLVTRNAIADAVYSSLNHTANAITPKSHPQFLGTRKTIGQHCDSDCMVALLPAPPFIELVLVDMPGASSEEDKTAILPASSALKKTLFVVVTTLEYWPARHTISLIKEYHVRYPGRFVVVANMADQVNADEIRRIRDRARQRMEHSGIAPAPPFFVLSAKLESARNASGDEYRKRVKHDVRDLCDAGFDAFRVALYEFEARNTSLPCTPSSIERLLNSPLAMAVIASQKGKTHVD